MKHFVLVSEAYYMDMHPICGMYVTSLPIDQFIKELKKDDEKCSVDVCEYKELSMDETYSRILSCIDRETSHPLPDSDDYIERLINDFDEAFENSEKTKDLWDYVRFANKRDEDVDNYLASQGLI